MQFPLCKWIVILAPRILLVFMKSIFHVTFRLLRQKNSLTFPSRKLPPLHSLSSFHLEMDPRHQLSTIGRYKITSLIKSFISFDWFLIKNWCIKAALKKKQSSDSVVLPFTLEFPKGTPPSLVAANPIGVYGEPCGLTYQLMAYFCHDPSLPLQKK